MTRENEKLDIFYKSIYNLLLKDKKCLKMHFEKN